VDDAVNALSTAERAVAIDPKAVDNYLALAEAELRLDLSSRAKKSLTHVTEQLQVTAAKQWLRIARLFNGMRRPEAAVEAALKGNAYEWVPMIGIGLASILANNGGSAEAADIVNTIEVAKIRSINALLDLYYVCITLKDEVRALAVVRRALELEPYHPKMRENLAWLELGSRGAQPDTQQKAKARPPGLFSRLFR
jgi:tetratricopeptide (TPR) repeat protein